MNYMKVDLTLRVLFLGNAMAELGRLLIYEASRDWLVSSYFMLCYNYRIFYLVIL